MMGNRKLMIIWVWLLLLASLYPWAHCKRGGGRGKGASWPAKTHPSQSKSSSRQGLKLAGAAAAGALGGAAVGYGLGSLGKQRYGYGYSEDDRRYYHPNGYHNQSEWRYYGNAGSSEHVANILVTLGAVAHIFMWG